MSIFDTICEAFRKPPPYKPVYNDCRFCGKNFKVPDGNPAAYDIMYCSCECIYHGMKNSQKSRVEELDRKEEKMLMNQGCDRFEILDL